jgi:hypothetical protein
LKFVWRSYPEEVMGGTNSNDVIASLVFYRDEPP